MEITYYFRLFQRWAWLLIAAGIVGGSLAYINEIQKVPRYRASSTISIGNYIESPNPDGYDIQIGRYLADTYVHLVNTYNVLTGAATALNNGLTADFLMGSVTANTIQDTSLLQISAQWDDPVIAINIANAVAEQLVVQSPSNLTPDQESQISFAQEQINSLNDQIVVSRQRLDELDRQISTTTDQGELTQLQRSRDGMINQINQASATIAQFTETVISLQRRVNAVEIVEQARVASVSNMSNPVFGTFVGIVIGVMLAAGVVLVIDYLDDTIHTSEEAAQTLSLPVLGAIIRFGSRKASYNERLMTNIPPMSAPSEAYRTLRTNVLFGAEHQDTTPVYVITSVGPEEGKSLTAANLAVTMAQAGLHVLLVDADLRRPKVHEIFGLENKVGLTTLLFVDPANVKNGNGTGTEDTTTINVQSPDLRQCLQNTSVNNLRVITSGFLPSNPAEILGSALMNRWMTAFRQASNINVIVVDTPPGLMVADSSVLAASVGADAIFVLDSGRTRRRAALKLKEQFVSLGIPIKGVVVNRVSQRDESDLFGYGYKYGYYYVNAEGTGIKTHGLRRFLPSRR